MLAMTQTGERTQHPRVEPGTTRDAIEQDLGWTWTSTANPDGSKSMTYTYRRYAPPQPDPDGKTPEARAKRYLLYDLIAVGIPEIAFTALETVAKVQRWRESESCNITITYGPDDRVITADRSKIGCR